MYTDVESSENLDEDFLTALALLRSSDVDSAEKLKKMLDTTIKKKCGNIAIRESTTTKKCEEFIPYSYDVAGAMGIVGEFEDRLKLMENAKPDDEKNFIPSKRSIVDDVSRSFDGIEDCVGDEEIPRISIPDEITDDGEVCKICKGDKLGPLIILECQDCQDVYHPLCHQPPVVDIDVYDPRLVWRCGKCVEASDSETSGVSYVVTVDDDDDDDDDDVVEVSQDGNENFPPKNRALRSSTVARINIRDKDRSTKPCFSRRTKRRTLNEENSSRKFFRSSSKKCSNSRITSNVGKRIGSKLNVNRPSFAKRFSVQSFS